MGDACTHDHDVQEPPRPNGEHPVVAILAIVAIILAIVLISWARVEVHGTGDLEAALAEPAAEEKPPARRPADERELDEAVTSSRWATGLSP
ncbi:MAG TPA: hypothetical protein VML57_06520 [Burkholderiales bacterium]|nr:hypothetical protein [Burkholderiales bacterium]